MKNGKVIAGALLTGAAAYMVYSAVSGQRSGKKKVKKAFEKTMKNCSCFLDDMASMMK